MKKYFLEGLYRPKKRGRFARQAEVEPFARLIWAHSLAEAIQQATEMLEGGEWLEGPNLSKLSEEEQMRRIGAPQLPGFNVPQQKSRKPR